MTDRWTDRLSDYLDDDEELSARDRRDLEAHLATCGECAAALADLRAITADAAAVVNLPPRNELWTGIAARITQVPVESGNELGQKDRFGRRYSFSIPQIAAAAVLLIALSAGGAWLLQSRGPGERQAERGAARHTDVATVTVANFADEEYDAAVADLEQALRDGRGRLDPETVAVLERNLQIIDSAIQQARRALDADPSNTYLNSHLADARRRKLALLRRATELATPMS